MGLVKCPDCGKMVSERVQACPECGCPAEFFEKSSEATVSKIDVELMKLNIAGHEIKYPMGEQAEYAELLGVFIDLARQATVAFSEGYDKSKNIGKALEVITAGSDYVLGGAVDLAIENLYRNKIVITPEEFLTKYYERYNMNHQEKYEVVLEAYANIMHFEGKLSEYHKILQSTRSKWVGGGFGVKGAIKGAVTASILNVGSSFLHSFGDAADVSNYKSEIKEELSKLYNDSRTRDLMVNSIWNCIVNVYAALMCELSEHEVVDKQYFLFDINKADIAFKHALNYYQNDESLFDDVIECIKVWPGNMDYYYAIRGIMCNLYEDNSDLKAFLAYWGINEYIENYIFEEDAVEDDMQFVERIKKHHTADESWIYASRKNLSTEILNDIRKRMERRDIGDLVLYYDNTNAILTSRYIFFDGYNPIKLEDLKSLVVGKRDCGKQDLLVFLKNDKYIFNVHFCNSLNLDEIVTYVNIGLDTVDCARGLEFYKTGLAFEEKYANVSFNNEIDTVDDYVFARKCIEELNDFDFANSAQIKSERYNIIRRSVLNMPLDVQEDILSYDRTYEWVRKGITKELFFKWIATDRSVFTNTYLKNIWIFGDDRSVINKSNSKVSMLCSGERVYLYKDFTIRGNEGKGFALTDNHIIVMEKNAKYRLSDIEKIYLSYEGLIEMELSNTGEKVIFGDQSGLSIDPWKDACYVSQLIEILYEYKNRFVNQEEITSGEIEESDSFEASETIPSQDNGLEDYYANLIKNGNFEKMSQDEYFDSLQYPLEAFEDYSEYSMTKIINDYAIYMIFPGKYDLVAEGRYKDKLRDYFKRMYEKQGKNGNWVQLISDAFTPEQFMDILFYFNTGIMGLIFGRFHLFNEHGKPKKEFEDDTRIYLLIENDENVYWRVDVEGIIKHKGFILTNRRVIDIASKKSIVLTKDTICEFPHQILDESILFRTNNSELKVSAVGTGAAFEADEVKTTYVDVMNEFISRLFNDK